MGRSSVTKRALHNITWFTIMFVLGVLVSILACAPSQPGVLPELTEERYDPDQLYSAPKRLVDHEVYTSSLLWPTSPWARVDDDPYFPKFLLIASDRSACLVEPDVWAVKLPGVWYTCKTPWRLWRS